MINDLAAGNVAPEDLNEELFFHNTNNLINAAGKGLKKDLMQIGYDDPDYSALTMMKKNLYSFSGAKTYSELKEMNALLYDENGRRVRYDVFKANATNYYRQAGIVDKRYYNWLKTEYEQSQISGDMAGKWHNFIRNTSVKNLKLVTVGDDHVRPAHVLMNGVIRPKNDPYWVVNFPPNGYLCRCDAVETDEAATPGEAPSNPDPGFNFNPGIANTPFSKNHPYYADSKRFRVHVEQRTDEFALNEYVAQNKAIYGQYKQYANFSQVSFNEQSGGFIVKHVNADKYNAAETQIIELLKDKGEPVILPELIKENLQRNFDLYINSASFDIKTINGKADRIRERLMDGRGQAGNFILNVVSNIPDKEIMRQLQHKDVTDISFNTLLIYRKGEWIVLTKYDIINGIWDAFKR